MRHVKLGGCLFDASPSLVKHAGKGKNMGKNEKTSKSIASIASKGLKNPSSLTKTEIKQISGSVLTQRPDKKK